MCSLSCEICTMMYKYVILGHNYRRHKRTVSDSRLTGGISACLYTRLCVPSFFHLLLSRVHIFVKLTFLFDFFIWRVCRLTCPGLFWSSTFHNDNGFFWAHLTSFSTLLNNRQDLKYSKGLIFEECKFLIILLDKINLCHYTIFCC